MKSVLSILVVYACVNTVHTETARAETGNAAAKNIRKAHTEKRWAVCIGINSYNDEKLNTLSRAANDAYGLCDVLKKHGGFTVFTFSDRNELRNKQPEDSPFFPTKSNIFQLLHDSITSKKIGYDDVVVFSFSGHGISDNKGCGYLLPADWQRDKPFQSAIAVSTVTEWLEELNVSKSLILLDACRVVLRGRSSRSPLAWLSGEKFDNSSISAVFYGTRLNGLSFEDPHTEYGALTRFIIYGLLGKSDINKNDSVTLKELSIYVEDSLISWAAQNGLNQRPKIQVLNEQNNDLILTKMNVRMKDNK